jgi:hypothetical protein
MSQMIIKDGQMIRISPKDSKRLEYSTTNGRSWSIRFSGASMGAFHDLTDAGKELLAQTDKGLYYSTTKGRSWSKRG